jgi:fucose 4-O-acetylase-like acetyltransferase
VVARAPRHTETAGRVAYLDNLKASLVAVVIAGHAWAGYTGIGSWMYSPAREATLSAAVTAALEALLGPVALFAMGLFLLMAGLLAPASVDRKGPARFARDRLVRLGVPLAAFAALLLPVTYALGRAAGHPVGAYGDLEHLWFLRVVEATYFGNLFRGSASTCCSRGAVGQWGREDLVRAAPNR